MVQPQYNNPCTDHKAMQLGETQICEIIREECDLTYMHVE